MRDRYIADEVVRQIPRESLLSLVNEAIRKGTVAGAHYIAWANNFPDDLNLTASIAVLAIRTEFDELTHEIRSEVLIREQVITVEVTPLPPNMRIQISCNADWIATAKARGYDIEVWQFIPPCNVAADIVRYLLRILEGLERATAWQPLRVNKTIEISPLLQPIVLNWRISELKRWVEDYQSDNNADITIFHSPAKGYVDIYNTYPRPVVGMRCEHPVNGAIELTPYILNDATPAAIAELQKWRIALEAGDVATAKAADATPARSATNQNGRKRDSGHFNYGPEMRATIVRHFYQERGSIANIGAWAQTKYQISARTLKRYRDDYDSITDT